MALILGGDGQGRQGRPTLLVLRALGLGDLLTGVPALRALRRAHPDHELVLAAPRALAPLVELAGAVDRLLPAAELAPVEWVGAPPDLAVNLHGRGPQSHRLLQALRPRRLVAFDCPEAGHDGPTWRADEHEARRWCRLVEEGLGVPADPSDLLLARPPTGPLVELVEAPVETSSGTAVVHPGAAYPSRRWPPERYAEVARWLDERGRRVLVTGGPDEVALARSVGAGAGLPEDAVLAGRTDLAELAAVVAGADLVVCGDTGVAHLATAFGTRSVLLFGPVSPDLWGPVTADAPDRHRVLWHGDGTGDPWAEQPDPALLAISVEDVLDAVAATVSALTAGARTTPASA